MATVNALKTKLRKALIARFPSAEISMKNPTAVGKLGATVIWDGFVGMDQIERHRAIREAVTGGLSLEERVKLSAIFGMTPDELAVMNS